MYVAWCMLNGLAGKLHTEEFPEMLAMLKSRNLSPGTFLIKACDEKFTDEDLTEEGNVFTGIYFDFQKGKYIADYERALQPTGLTLYHVPDTWESYDKLAPIITRRYQNWKKYGSLDEPPKPWWRFWS